MISGVAKTRSVYINGNKLSPAKSLKVVRHSPTGFYWGYGGSGPAQLAMAILLLVTDKNTALDLYQSFKWDHVAKWQGDFIKNVDVKAWIVQQRSGGNEHY